MLLSPSPLQVREALDSAVELRRPVVVYVVIPPLAGSTASAKGLPPADVVPLLFRRGVSPADVYGYLRHAEDERIRVDGEYIRAEALVAPNPAAAAAAAAAGSKGGNSGGLASRVVLKKEAPLEEDQRVIKIFTNKVKSWQKRH